MRFGAHVSAAGGLFNGPKNGAALGCEVIQIFSRPPQSWAVKAITDDEALAYRQASKANKIEVTYIHAPYLINLASSTPRTRHGSVTMLRQELDRGTQIGARAMMFHPGSAKDVGEAKGVQMVIEGLNRILDGYKGTCQLLIEISAGAGMVMGDTFEEIATFIDGAERGKEIGVCFDTQHAFASGYDLRTKESVDAVLKKFDKLIGLKKMIASHCNDSMVEFDSHKDRHEHLGKGKIGLEGFKAIVAHPKLQHLDLILETPWDDALSADMKYLKKFRGK
ncbi:MAG: deoxyribonuclease IV [Patescibacteria group bacterium]